MNRRGFWVWVVLLGLTAMASARAQTPPASVQVEIDYLLGRISTSGCEFNRNSTWYDGQRAVAHIRYKYAELTANSLVTTTDDFIEMAASRSSMTGNVYLIRCSDSILVTSGQWLRDQLAAYRLATSS